MLLLIEDLAIGAILIALAALGLARSAVYFRNREPVGEQFFSTSATSVLLVALVVSGGAYIGRAAFVSGGLTGGVLGVAGIVYLVLVMSVFWRLFGPRPDPVASRSVA